MESTTAEGPHTSPAWVSAIHTILSDPEGIRQYADARTLPIIESVTEMYQRRIAGVPFDPSAVALAADAAARAARETGASIDAESRTADVARVVEAAASAAGGDALGHAEEAADEAAKALRIYGRAF